MTKIYSAGEPTQAHLIIGLLAEHGIKATIQGEALWSARGELPLTPETSPSIWVADDADAARALELISSSEKRPNPKRCAKCGHDLQGLTEPRCPECGWAFRLEESWECPACGQVIEGQFTQCWSCYDGPGADDA